MWTKGTGNTVHFEATLSWEAWAPAGIPRKMILTNGIAQIGTPWSDGTPGLSQRPIPAGDSFLYKWRATDYGSYFYHAHSRGQVDDGLYGSIYIHPADSVERPFALITDKDDLRAMRVAEDRTTPIMLSDWRQLTSEEVWAAEEATRLDGYCVNALLINGKSSISCLGQDILDQYTTPAQELVLDNSERLSDTGINAGNFPHNFSDIPPSMFSGCTPSNSTHAEFFVDPDAGYASYDLISAAGTNTVVFSIDEHPIKGPPVPSINLTGAPVSSNCAFLSESTIIPFPVEVPSQDVAQTRVLNIDRFNASYRWTVGNTSLPLAAENEEPLLLFPETAQSNVSLATLNGTWVDLIFHVLQPLQPPHPIHKHSNKFFVIGEGEGEWKYSSVVEAIHHIPHSFNLQTPQIRVTYYTPAAATGPAWLAIRYHVVNPSAFLLHCHIQVHLSGGMGLPLLDGINEWPEVSVEYWEGLGSYSAS
ncbi:hypothetical protein BBP40_012452 [Aspergillus hancockii]|nr:hypothetical protein BBP40_012452 [Aspergillus hancockii]